MAWPADLLPSYLKASFPTTNEGALGYAFDNDTSPKVLSLIQVRAGQLAASGSPRGWQNGEVTPIQNVAKGFAGLPDGTNSVDRVSAQASFFREGSSRLALVLDVAFDGFKGRSVGGERVVGRRPECVAPGGVADFGVVQLEGTAGGHAFEAVG